MVTRKTRTKLAPQLAEGFYDALGHTIKVARTDLGIDRKDLAERAGISYSYLAAIENGHKQPSSQVLLALAEALGLRTHELLESAEGRRDRNLTTTEEFPHWLTGRDHPQAMRMAAAPPAPDPMESAWSPASPDDPRESFAAKMARLTARMSDSDRQLLLDMAGKLAE